jgi:hypothetical protein
MENRWKTAFVVVLLFLPSVFALETNVTFLINDSICDRAQNESRLNSHDCGLTASQVWDCALDEQACVDDNLFRDITIGLVLAIGTLLVIRFKDHLHKRPPQQDRFRKLRYVRKGHQ